MPEKRKNVRTHHPLINVQCTCSSLPRQIRFVHSIARVPMLRYPFKYFLNPVKCIYRSFWVHEVKDRRWLCSRYPVVVRRNEKLEFLFWIFNVCSSTSFKNIIRSGENPTAAIYFPRRGSQAAMIWFDDCVGHFRWWHIWKCVCMIGVFLSYSRIYVPMPEPVRSLIEYALFVILSLPQRKGRIWRRAEFVVKTRFHMYWPWWHYLACRYFIFISMEREYSGTAIFTRTHVMSSILHVLFRLFYNNF